MEPLKLIEKYYDPATTGFDILVEHSRMVADKCLEIAARVPHLHPDISFLEEAAMLHDIGILFTRASSIGCFGSHEYICHGYLGRELLEREGLPEHALVCERHVGVGLSAHDIVTRRLPLPVREMLPLTIEEKIICYADKFYSKESSGGSVEKTPEEVRKRIERYGTDMRSRFDEMDLLFSRRPSPGKVPLQRQ